jgi:hypothetical protein
VIIARLVGLFFAFVQVTLALRLVLPFVSVPDVLAEFVPTLVAVTDLWLAPVYAVLERVDLFGMSESLLESATGVPAAGPQEFEPVILLAMLLWAGIAVFVLFVLRLIFRPLG